MLLASFQEAQRQILEELFIRRPKSLLEFLDQLFHRLGRLDGLHFPVETTFQMMVSILDAVIRSSFEMLDHFAPFRSLQAVQSKENSVFGNTPSSELESWLEVIEVSLSALLSSSTRNSCRNLGPHKLVVVGRDRVQEYTVFDGSPHLGVFRGVGGGAAACTSLGTGVAVGRRSLGAQRAHLTIWGPKMDGSVTAVGFLGRKWACESLQTLVTEDIRLNR